MTSRPTVGGEGRTVRRLVRRSRGALGALARRDGRLPAPGHDYAAGHLAYVSSAGRHGLHYLRTKPFDAPPTHELPYALRTFSHMVELLELDTRAQVLDAGCGPGWLSEFLARCGYWVTGVDVSPDMIAIARDRVAALATDAGLGTPPLAELHAMRVIDIPWTHRFDAVIVNDSLHHFDQEGRTLEVLLRSLVPGGRIFIHEAAWPRRRRDARAYVEEMERHGTLESPFRPRYLRQMLEASGFAEVRRLAPIDRAFTARSVLPALWHTVGRTLIPKTNTFVARAPAPAGELPDFCGRLEATEVRTGTGTTLFRLSVENRGRRYWPAGSGDPLPIGAITVAPHVASPAGERIELPRITLPTPLSPGERVEIDAVVETTQSLGGDVSLSLVREGITWFADPPSTTIRIAPAP